jgi:hypothetical protein
VKTNGHQKREIDEIYDLVERQGALLIAMARQVARLSSCVGCLLNHEGLSDAQSEAILKLVSEQLFQDLISEIGENVELMRTHDKKKRKKRGPQHPS